MQTARRMPHPNPASAGGGFCPGRPSRPPPRQWRLRRRHRRPPPRPRPRRPAGTGGKPNILVIMGDDIGWFNPSCYNSGMMGYHTPNIDRIANEGALFTDWYGQQSCTAGRAAFITGQSPIRTGLTKVGLPGRRHRPAARRPERRRFHEEPRLRHRPVRQEPPGRPGQVPADQSTASTSSSAISITSTPRKSRRIPTIRRTPSSGRSSARAASCTRCATSPIGKQRSRTPAR